MKTLLTNLLLTLSCAVIAQNIPNVVFNELNVDNPGGADASEFVELYGTPGASLDSLVLVLFEGGTDLSYQAYDLDGYVLDNNGFFVLGNAGAANVDYVIPNATISNGADGIALYIGDATDFPTDTPPTTINLIDAAVYGTGDPADTGLITALGLDVSVPGYVQLDETAQQAGADLSISRTPDGGNAFDFGAWTLQEITAGTFNSPPCFAANVTTDNGETSVSLCAGSAQSIVALGADSTSFGETAVNVITDGSGNIQFTTASNVIDFSTLPIGSYAIYNVRYNGILDEATVMAGMPVSGILAGNCVSIATSPIAVDLVSCSGCIGGQISASISTGASYCGSSIPMIVTSNNSTSIEDNYLYVIANTGGAILDTFSISFDAGSYEAGTYVLYGLSYMGTLSNLDSLNTVTSDLCLEWSQNSIEFTLLDCPYVVFNELNMDNPGGADTAEFLELFGTPGAALDGLVLVLFEGTTDNSYAAYDLDGYSLDNYGFFVLGNDAAVNVDYIIPDATISNGADGVGLYIGNDTDFPNGTLPTTVNLIEAAVYGTGDQPDVQLIAALGLDIAVPGYTQLDETFQQNFPDFSLSRVPDGGQPFNFSPYLLQDITPGTWNQPQCIADSVFAGGATSFCDNDPMAIANWYSSNFGYGDHAAYIIADAAGAIIEINEVPSYNFTGFTVGSYTIYGLSYNGDIDSSSIAAGMNMSGIMAGNCVSISDNFIAIDITPCSGCVGGEISLSSGSLQRCNFDAEPLVLVSSSTSLDDSYVYVLSDTSGVIVSTGTASLSTQGLAAGSYLITGISYQGIISGLNAGSILAAVSSSVCAEFSSNTISIALFDCQENTPCTSLFFSEYLEGTNGTKALELFNPSLETIDLSAYSIHQYANGVTAASNVLNLTGTLGPFGTYVIANPGQGGGGGGASQTVLGLADLIDPIANYNGNDALELRRNDTVVDVIGVVGENPGTGNGWPVGTATTFDVDLVRQFNIQSPMPIWAISAGQWDVYAVNDYTHLGNHFFQPCTDETLAGFVNGNFNVAENAGTLTINVQCLNAGGPLTLVATLLGGTADNTDYTVVLPDTLSFNDSTSLQSFTLDIINDAIAEGAETIILTLTSDSAVVWLQQTITITINQSDPNCDGGFLFGAGQGPITQCSDLPNAPVDLTPNTNTANANYVFVITDANDMILEIVTTSPVSLDAYGEGTFHIWGLSYTGNLDMETVGMGMPVNGIIADQCADISNNFATIIRTPCIIIGCDAGDVLINDGADFITICGGDVHIDITMTNTSQSIDASYTYFVTDPNGVIIEQIDSVWSGASAAPGTYYIYGVSYLNTLIESTTAPGMPISGVAADYCVQVSANYVEAVVYNCNGAAPCSQLFFSEVIEDTQSNKALEIYNPSPLPVDLSNYSINLYSNGSATPTATLALSGTLAAHDVYVVTSSGNGQNPTDQAILDVTDVTSAVSVFTGNDAIELLFQGTAIDIVGVIGVDPGGNGWVFGNSSTANHVLVRRPEVTSPNTDWNIVSGQWISYTPTDFTHLGSHTANDCGNVPVAVVGFTTDAQTVAEINGTVVTVTIHTENVQSSFQLVVNASGTATANSDFSAGFPLSFTVPTGTNDLTFSIVINGDAITEGDETIVLDLSANANVYFNIPTQTITITENVGVREQIAEGMAVYPNPASTSVTIKATHALKSIQCMDMSGRVVYTYQPNGHQTQVTLPIDQISAGSYFVQVQTENGISRVPLQVVK
jgi:Lamin Tail Domain/Secretion system C-terminal sorting domain/Calx-beta domain